MSEPNHIDVRVSEQADGTTRISWDEPGRGEQVYFAPKGTDIHDILEALSEVGTPHIKKVRRSGRSQ